MDESIIKRTRSAARPHLCCPRNHNFVLVQAEEHLLQLRRRSRVGAVQASQGPQAHRDGQDGVPQPEHEQLLVSFSRPEYNIMYRCLKSKLEILF